MRLGNFLWGADHLIRYPDYPRNFKKYSEILWESNSEALNYLQKQESTFFKSNIGKYLNNAVNKNTIYEAFKKNSLENISGKILYLKIYQELQASGVNFYKLLPVCADCNGVDVFLGIKISEKLKSNIAVFFNFFYAKFYAFFFFIFSPYVLRDFIRKGFVLFSSPPQAFYFGFHAVDTIQRQGFINDALSFKLGKSAYKKSLFVYSIWKFSSQEREKLRETITSIGASEADENNIRIPLRLIISLYLKNYLYGVFYFFKICFSNEKIESWAIKHVQKILMEYWGHVVFCQYYHVEIFFSRDDYSSKHICRTIVQNKFGLLNTGLQHSAFLYPKYIPQVAHVLFDVYFIAGSKYKELWCPYWDRNKSLIPVGHKAEDLVKKALLNVEVSEKFFTKYKKKITILLLISSHSDTISPFWLLKERYNGIHHIFEIDQNIHLILRPRYKDAIDSFLSLCPELNEFIKNDRCTIEFGDFSTQELIAYVDVLVAEDASSSLLESLCRDDLFSFFYMIRYGEFIYQKNLVVDNAQGFCEMITSYLNKDDKYYLANKARDYIKTNFTVMPSGETMQRIGVSLNGLLQTK